jgi:hypothetical protein
LLIHNWRFPPQEEGRDQGDQIGKKFASWAVAYFGRFLKTIATAGVFCLLFPQ